jgi:hypothetical protein
MTRFRALIDNDVAFVIAASASSFIAGGMLSYIVTKKQVAKKYEKHYNANLAEEIEKANHYNRWVATKIKVEKEMNENLLEHYDENGIIMPETLGPIDETPDELNWNEEEELASRNEEIPFVISTLEFENEFPEYDKITYTYYEEEDVLLNENEEVVQEIDLVVGITNLQRFGDGSKDLEIVYIRNHELEADYEIRRMGGSYVEEVLGYIEHSRKRRRRHSNRREVLKFRPDLEE